MAKVGRRLKGWFTGSINTCECPTTNSFEFVTELI